MMKPQVHVAKVFINTVTQRSSLRTPRISRQRLSRRLLASFQDKYEHVGPKHKMIQGYSRKKVSVLKRLLKYRLPLSSSSTTRKDLKISELKTKSKDNDKGSRSNITMHEEMKPLQQHLRLRPKTQELKDNED
ncbi:hypothetical protein Tco_1390734 [Tanacetum coccineum]